MTSQSSWSCPQASELSDLSGQAWCAGSFATSGRLWNQKVVSFFKSLGFEAFNADASILIHHGKERNDITMISVYVDDILLASKHQTSLDWIKGNLKNEYKVKDLGEVKTIIGCQVTRNWNAATLKIDQSPFIWNLLEEKNPTDCNAVTIPMKAGSFIEIHENDGYKEANLSSSSISSSSDDGIQTYLLSAIHTIETTRYLIPREIFPKSTGIIDICLNTNP